MASVNYLKLARKGGLISLLFLCVHQTAWPQDPALQSEFEQGLQEVFANNYYSAMVSFEALYQKTQSPRVKLEWARAAFLARNYPLSEQLFEEVLANNPPDTVKFNISLYLSEISKLSDRTDYGFSFKRDTNPFSLAKPQEILIFGLPFQYSPPIEKKTLTGFNVYLNHAASLNRRKTIRFIGNIENTQYEGNQNNKSSIRLGLQIKQNPADPWNLLLGTDHYFQKGQPLVTQMYVGTNYRQDQLIGPFNQYEFEFKAANQRYPDYAFLEGQLLALNFSAAKNVSPHLQLGASLYADDSTANLKSQAMQTLAISGFAKWFIPRIASQSTLTYTYTSRNYKDIDELFLIKRQDHQQMISIALQAYTLKIFSLYPAIEIGAEKLVSTIGINSYQRQYINFLLKKNF